MSETVRTVERRKVSRALSDSPVSMKAVRWQKHMINILTPCVGRCGVLKVRLLSAGPRSRRDEPLFKLCGAMPSGADCCNHAYPLDTHRS